MAGKVTQVNVEGRNYGFVAGQAAKGACTALAADWVKPITLPEGTTLVDGMIVSIVFVNTTSVGYSGIKTVYSSDGLHFFYDQALTDPVELPPAGCYDAVNIQGQEYTLACFPVITFGSLSLPVCDSRGHYAGGALWAAGDTVAALYLDDRFMLLYSVVDEVTEGVSSPVSSNAVARDCVLKSEITDEVAIGNMYSVYSDAVAQALEWEDITSTVTLSKQTPSGYFTSYTPELISCYKQGNNIKLSFFCKFTASLGSGYVTLKIKVTSSKFTMSSLKSRVASCSYYGGIIIGILTNEYIGEADMVNIRIPAGSTIASGSDITVNVAFPV